jgi:hypothetical protein
VFRNFLGFPDGELTDQQRAARRELLPKLRAMRGGPHADAALQILLEVYGFSHAAKAWDPASGDPGDRPKQPEETAAGALAGPPPTVAARRRFDFRGGIRLLTLAQDGKTLLIGDSNMLDDPSGSRVILLNPGDLSEKARTSIPIQDKLPWSSRSAVLGPDGRHVLLFNRYLDLDTLKTTSVLDIKKAVAKGNVYPEPLGISPNGKLALVQVSSYLDLKLNTLALFDLASGKLARAIDLGEEQPIANACFLDEKTLAVQGRRGHVLAVDLPSGKQRDLCDHGPRAACPSGLNWHMAALAKGRYLVVSGYQEFVVIETSQGKEVFRKTIAGGNAVPVLGGRFLLYLYQGTVPGAMWQTVFFCARVNDGKVVAEFSRNDAYDLLIPGEQDDVIYGVQHNTLSKLRFQWGKLVPGGR